MKIKLRRGQDGFGNTPVSRSQKAEDDPAKEIKRKKKKTFYFILVFQMTNNPGYSMNAPDM